MADIVSRRHGSETGSPRRGGEAFYITGQVGVTNQLLAGAWAAAEARLGVSPHQGGTGRSPHQGDRGASTASGEQLELEGWIEDRLYELERLYRSIGVLGELTARGRDHVAAFGEQLSVHILAAALRERSVRSRALLATVSS